MRNILLTGANGYIGRHVLQELVARGEQVSAVVLQQPNERLPQVTYIIQDIFDEEKMSKLLIRPYDLCIHLAWEKVLYIIIQRI